MSKRETTEILGNVFTYTEALVSLAMQRKRAELLADARELKYAGTSRLNKRDLAIMLVDAHLAELDAVESKNTADAPRTMADRYADGFEFDGRDDVYLRETFDLWSKGDENADWAALYRAGMRAIVEECHARALEMNKTVKPARKMERYSHWAMSFPLSKYGDGNVCQGHADYCAEYGHATEKSTDLNGVTTVAGHCPRCGDTLKTAEQVISERDTIDQRQMVDVMTQVVDNGREDLIPVLDKIDAAQCQVPDGRDSTIPRVHFCSRCADSTNPCDQCVLSWLVALFKITGDVTLNKLPAVAEFDCYA